MEAPKKTKKKQRVLYVRVPPEVHAAVMARKSLTGENAEDYAARAICLSLEIDGAAVGHLRPATELYRA